MPDIIPPKSKMVGTSLRLPKDLLETVDRIAKATGHNRSEVVVYFLRFAVNAYENQQGGGLGPEKRR